MRKITLSASLFLALLLISCSTLREEVIPSARDPSGMMYLKNYTDSFAKDRMISNCRSLGGLDFSSLYETQKGNGVEKRWYYKCNNKPSDSALTKQYLYQDSTEGHLDSPRRIDPVNTGPSITTSALNEAKKKCVDLGFKSGTEEFGKCVLQLSK